MKIINNITEKLADDLRVTMKKDSRVSIAAACFSVYAFEELKTQLENLDELHFIFTSPAFLDEKPKKAQREFYIPRLNRERALHGSEFEIKLRSEFRQRAISQECAHWIREKARFKSNKTMEGMTGFLTVDSDSPVAYAPVNGFTREDLGCDRGGRMFSMINRVDAPESKAYLELFDQLWNDQSHLKDVTDKVLESITTAYQENSPEFLYFYALYNIFGSFLEQVNEDDLPSEANGFKESQVWNKLYTFQKDAVIAIISKLEQYNGCILADSVGLGKTFTALAVIKYYENRNLRVLILCPKKLSDNWMTYKANYVNNPIAGDRLRYDVLCPIRPILPDGRWGSKQRREYVLDEHGERIRDEAGDYVFNAVPTTDWGSPDTLEQWRQAWAELCNAKFAEKGLDCRIDHRSYERQGVEQLPTVHEGPTVKAMEQKGIHTDKGDLNRWIRKTNAMLREAKAKIASLLGWLKEVKAELSAPRPPTLVKLLSAYYDARNKGAYSGKAKIGNLKKFSETVSYLESKQLRTTEDLDALLNSMQEQIDTLKESASGKQARIKELDELLRMADYYQQGKPVADKLKTIRFEKSRQKYKAEHENVLRTFYMAERKLKDQWVDGKIPIHAWRREKAKLETEYEALQQTPC